MVWEVPRFLSLLLTPLYWKPRVVMMTNFVVTCGTGGCRYDNIRCQQGRQSWHHLDSLCVQTMAASTYRWAIKRFQSSKLVKQLVKFELIHGLMCVPPVMLLVQIVIISSQKCWFVINMKYVAVVYVISSSNEWCTKSIMFRDHL